MSDVSKNSRHDGMMDALIAAACEILLKSSFSVTYYFQYCYVSKVDTKMPFHLLER